MQSRFIGADGCRWLPCVNGSGEVIPAYAVMRFTGMDANRDAVTVDKPNRNGHCDAVNGPVAIPIGGTGNCTEDFPNWARTPDGTGDGSGDGSGGSGSDELTPVNGNIWGPRAGSWTLHNNQAGFKIIGGFVADEHRVYVTRDVMVGGTDDGSGSGGPTEVVTNVVCDGDDLVVTRATISIVNGVIVLT